jgi:gas vesicle protein
MISQTRTAFKFFTYGLLIGLLFAPKSGKENRADAMAWVQRTIKETIGM